MDVNDKVEVCGGSGKWFPGVIIKLDATNYEVRLVPAVMSSVWIGRPRRDGKDGEITIVTISRNAFTNATSIRLLTGKGK